MCSQHGSSVSRAFRVPTPPASCKRLIAVLFPSVERHVGSRRCARDRLRHSMPKKPVGILKRNAYTPKSAAGPQKRKKRPASHAAEVHEEAALVASDSSFRGSLLPQQQQQHKQFWNCQSEIDRQAAACISKVLASDASRRNGKTIKSLTLAPNIKAKKAVYAVTCQTLQCMARQLRRNRFSFARYCQ